MAYGFEPIRQFGDGRFRRKLGIAMPYLRSPIFRLLDLDAPVPSGDQSLQTFLARDLEIVRTWRTGSPMNQAQVDDSWSDCFSDQ
jgi:hypothetical protein